MQRTALRTLAITLRASQPPSRPLSSLSSFESTLLANSSSSPSLISTSSTRPPAIQHATTSPSQAKPTDPAALDPDAQLLSVLARLIMRDGKLARTHSHLDDMLAQLQLTTGSPPIPLLRKAIELSSPSIRIVGRRQGTKVLQTPQPLTAEQRRRQAWKWIVEASDKRQGVEKKFGKRLALEVLAVLSGQSEALKKLEGRHTQGVTGRANVGR